MSLSLPQIPCRLVIEISSPDASTGQLTGDSEDRVAVSGQLALIRDTVSSRPGRTEATRR